MMYLAPVHAGQSARRQHFRGSQQNPKSTSHTSIPALMYSAAHQGQCPPFVGFIRHSKSHRTPLERTSNKTSSLAPIFPFFNSNPPGPPQICLGKEIAYRHGLPSSTSPPASSSSLSSFLPRSGIDFPFFSCRCTGAAWMGMYLPRGIWAGT